MRRSWWVGIGAVAVVLVLLVGLLWLFQRRLIFVADRADPGPAAAWMAGGRDVTLVTEDGLSLVAWYLPARPDCDVTVLVAPGNAGHRAGRVDLFTALHERGLGVLAMDYRGYGGNPGDPTEDGLRLDALAARAFLEAELPTGRLVYFGESLGAAVVTRLAVTHPPAAMVLRSPFTELADVAAEQFPWFPVRALLRDEFPVLTLVGQLGVPVTVIYGDSDSLVPPEQSVAVAQAAEAALVTVTGADHNDSALVHGPLVIDSVLAAAGCG